MLARNHLGRIQITFNDHRLVALYLGLPQLVDPHLDLGDAPDRANPGDKMITLVVSARRFRVGRLWTAAIVPPCTASPVPAPPPPRSVDSG